MSIYEDRTGTLWVGTENGLNAFDRQQSVFTHYTNDPANPHSLSDNRVRAVYQDRSGLLWLGTHRGVSTLNTQPKFALYRHTSGALNSNYVRALHQDEADMLWIGTNDGLSRFNRQNGEFVRYTHHPKYPTGIRPSRHVNLRRRPCCRPTGTARPPREQKACRQAASARPRPRPRRKPRPRAMTSAA